jgi:hypothetical protein
VNLIRSIEGATFKTLETIYSEQKSSPFYEQRCAKIDGVLINLNEIYVDITYQRSLRLKKLLDHLKKKHPVSGDPMKFDEWLAGSVDLAVRPIGNKIFVWDGLRRCLLAMLQGLTTIPANVLFHPKDFTETQCMREEAYKFSIRNGQAEKMLGEELYKSGVACEDKKYLEVYRAMKDCGVNVLRVPDAGVNLTGYKQFEKTIVTKPFEDLAGEVDSNNTTLDYMIRSSSDLQKADIKGLEANISAYAITGNACFLYWNNRAGEKDELSTCYIEDGEILQKLQKWAKGYDNTETNLVKDRVHSCFLESVAYKFAVEVYGLNKIQAVAVLPITFNATTGLMEKDYSDIEE